MGTRQAILVLGMHRSGTSTVTRVLSMLGAALPARLMPAAKANELGFFEPDAIVRIHDTLLERVGSSWHDHRPLDLAGPARDEAVHALAEAMGRDYGDAPLAVVKDPRICRLLPLWRDVLAQVGREPLAVLVHRPATEVAASLTARDHLPGEQGLLLWLRHALEAEFHSRTMPRFVLSYDEMLGADQGWIARMSDALPAGWTRTAADVAPEAAGFVDPRLRHQKSGGGSVPPAWIRETQAAYDRLETDARDTGAMSALDGIRTALDEATALLLGAERGMRATRLARLRGSLANAWDARLARFRANRS